MPDTPPPDPADHAEDFAHRYAQELDYLAGDRMAELGIPTGKIGSRVPDPAGRENSGSGAVCMHPH